MRDRYFRSATLIMAALLSACRDGVPATSETASTLSIGRRHELVGHEGMLADAIYSPDGATLVSCDRNGVFVGWRADDGTERWRWSEPGFACQRMAYARGGGFIAAAALGEVLVLDVVGGRLVRRYPVRAGVSIDAVAISDDQARLAVGAGDTFVRLIEIASGEITVVAQHEWPIIDVRFLDRDRLLLAGDPTSIRVWNVDTGREERRLLDTAQGDIPDVFWLTRMAFTEDQDFVVAGSGNDGVMFNMATRRVEQRFSGHQDELVSIRLSTSGSHVVTASRDLSVRFWNVDTGAVEAEAVALDLAFPVTVNVSPRENQFALTALRVGFPAGSFRPSLNMWNIHR